MSPLLHLTEHGPDSVGPQVLHLRSSTGLYGAENMVLGLIPALRAAGMESRLLALQAPNGAEQPLLQRAAAQGVRAELLPCAGRLDPRTVQVLRRWIAQTPRPVLHVHDYKSAFYAWLARAGRRIPIVATSHGQFNDSARLQLYHRIELALMRRFEQVCVVSAAMLPVLRAAGVPPARTRLIENGIDTRRFDPAVTLPVSFESLGLRPGCFVFGSAMRLAEQKFPLGLIEAYAASRHAAQGPTALVIAGDGPLRGAALSRAHALGVADEVKLLGARADLAACLARFDTFVLPSLFEGLPLALLEAMSMGRPLVATPVGQVPEVLAQLPVDWVPAGDVAALGQVLRAVRDRTPDPAARHATSLQLRGRVEQSYSVARMAAEYAALYRDLCPP